MSYDRLISSHQREPVLGRTMVINSEGGYVFEIDKWKRLDRFLILGSDGGSYYASPKKLTKENAKNIIECVKENGQKTIERIVEVSDKGLTIRNDAAIFALAVATVFGNKITRNMAFEAMPKVCRIGTHLFQFCAFREALGGGWGRSMRNAVAGWYQGNGQYPFEKVIFQLLKYQQRDGWSHRDLLRLSHPVPQNRLQQAAFHAVVKKDWTALEEVPIVSAYNTLHRGVSPEVASTLILAHGVPRELVPTELLKEPAVWDALLHDMPLTAMVRNLGNMSKIGILNPMSWGAGFVRSRLSDEELLHKARIHPMSILLALKTYASGKGFKGSNSWDVNQDIVAALDGAFYKAFHNVESTGKRILVGVDVSGSMTWSMVSNANMSAAEAAAAVAMMIKRTEPNSYIMGFSTQFIDLGISAADSLETVLSKTAQRAFGGTNTSVAINWAMQRNLEIDVFVVLTDNETWAGDTHTFQALEKYRKLTGIPTKLAVCAFTSNGFSVGDPKDFLSMDFVGLDASLPEALRAFMVE